MTIELAAGGGILGIIYFILLIWSLYHIIQSNRGFLAKLVWIAIVLIFPILGWLAVVLLGPRAGR
ncbi:phospholipase D-like protein [Stella humosa]|uniref:Phospholipase D-like protein n=1 Tax=Stella humosa TaxID=94 RepID=A0A3N1MAH7_9PROT|nr:PLDc N-terminal domain-containing protein [Stella humosa]ROQ00065.1 phospholipase D-like protein [Stella humosa]BBK30702.1 hypothetical protein STHU_13360 [Stella humosa]